MGQASKTENNKNIRSQDDCVVMPVSQLQKIKEVMNNLHDNSRAAGHCNLSIIQAALKYNAFVLFEIIDMKYKKA